MAYPQITTYPPLGQSTLIPPEKQDIPLTLIIEWSSDRPPYPFEFFLAFASGNTTQHESQWNITQLTETPHQHLHILGTEDLRRAAYTGKLDRKDLAVRSSSSRHFLFTVKFRVNDYAPWQWMSVIDGRPPGELILQEDLGTISDSASVSKHVKFTSDWTLTHLGSDASLLPTSTFLVESVSPIQRTPGNALVTLNLASLPSVRYFSVVRLEPYWLGPRQGKGPFFHVGEDAIVSSFLLNDGLIVTFVVLGWVDDVYQVFQNDGQGGIAIAAQNDNENDKHYQVIMSIGLSFKDTMSSAMDQVRKIVSSSLRITDLRKSTNDIITNIDLKSAAKSAEQWQDSLAFCTWNALGQDLTESKILTALEELQKHDIAISTLLIDDNWQTLGPITSDKSKSFDPGWADMEANTTVAPTGLKNLITTIRTQYPDIKDIGVWHALMGYWGGMCPTGQIARDYATTQIPALLMNNTPADVTTIAPSVLHRFYDDFYAFLKDAGVTFVKTDVQHMLSMIQNPRNRRDLVAAYQSAWTGAHLRHFGGKAISCMSQTPQTLFHSLLVQLRQTAAENTAAPALPRVVHRNSDDFYPEVAASHPWHVWTNAHNAVFTTHLNVLADWDMFQTDHAYSAYHAAARCVSGGPILITDVPGKHDVGLIHQMTAKNPAGVAVALRTAPGVAVDVFGLYTDGNVLKVRADGGVGGVVMALFNIAEQNVRGTVHVKDFDLPAGADEVLMRAHRAGEVFGPIVLSSPGPAPRVGDGVSEALVEMAKLVHVRLDVRGWDILTAQPVHRVQTSAEEQVKVCVLGLLGKMSGVAAITSSSVSVEDSKIRVRTSLKAVGRLGVWFDRKATQGAVEVQVQGSRVDDRFLQLVVLPDSLSGTGGVGDAGNHGSNGYAGSESKMQHVWEVDVESFWKERELWGESYEEVLVEVLIG